MPVVYSVGGQFLPQRPAVGVVSHRSYQDALRAQCHHVGRHVGRPAEGGAPFVDHDDWHRGLGRQAVGVSNQIAIENQIPHDDDAAAPHAFRQLEQPVACQGRWGGDAG